MPLQFFMVCVILLGHHVSSAAATTKAAISMGENHDDGDHDVIVIGTRRSPSSSSSSDLRTDLRRRQQSRRRRQRRQWRRRAQLILEGELQGNEEDVVWCDERRKKSKKGDDDDDEEDDDDDEMVVEVECQDRPAYSPTAWSPTAPAAVEGRLTISPTAPSQSQGIGIGAPIPAAEPTLPPAIFTQPTPLPPTFQVRPVAQPPVTQPTQLQQPQARPVVDLDPAPTRSPTMDPTPFPIATPSPTSPPTNPPTNVPLTETPSSLVEDVPDPVVTIPVDGEDDNDEGEEEGEAEEGPHNTVGVVEGVPAEACQAARYGTVYETPRYVTIYYQYELLTNRTANLPNVVWPAVDEAFSTFLAKTLVDCNGTTTTTTTTTESGPLFSSSSTSLTFPSQSDWVYGVSPEPRDTFGTSFPTDTSGNTADCTGIGEYDNEKLFCDIVTGSVTVYLKDGLPMNGIGDDSQEGSAISNLIGLRNMVYGALYEGVNSRGSNDNIMDTRGGGSRSLRQHPAEVESRRLNFGSWFHDPSKGIYGIYFLSEPIETLERPPFDDTGSTPSAESSGGNNNTIAASGTTLTGVIVSVVGVTLLVMAIVGLAIHKKKARQLAEEDETRMKHIYDLDANELHSPSSSFPRGRRSLSVGHSDSDSFLCGAESDTDPIKSMPMPTGTRDPHRARPNNDLEGLPAYDFGTIYGLAESSYNDDEWSRDGVSIRLKSPDSVYEDTQGQRKSSPISSMRLNCFTRPPPEGLESDNESSPDSQPWMANFDHGEGDHDSFISADILPPPSTSQVGDSESDDDLSTKPTEEWTTKVTRIPDDGYSPFKKSAANEILDDLDEEQGGRESSADGYSDTSTIPSTTPAKDRSTSFRKAPLDPPSEILNEVILSPHTHPNHQTPSKGGELTEGTNAASTGDTKLLCKTPSKKDLSNTVSPDSVVDSSWSFWRSPAKTHAASPTDDSSSVMARVSSTSPSDETSATSSRAETLKSRRRELEDRFKLYKQRLSETVSSINESSSSGESWMSAREVSRGQSLKKNNESFNSGEEVSRMSDATPSLAKSNLHDSYGFTPSTYRQQKENHTPPSEADQSTLGLQPRKGARQPFKSTFRRYACLNDIEDILDHDQEWKTNEEDQQREPSMPVIPSEEAVSDLRAEEMRLNEFLFSRAHAVAETPPYEQFTADTVQL